MFEAFAAMRRRHELLWYLAEAAGLAGAEGLRGEVEAAAGALENGTIAAATEMFNSSGGCMISKATR